MNSSSYSFLKTLLETPGPVGHEGPVQEAFTAYVDAHADSIVQFAHGSVAAIRNPEGSPRIIVTGHADEIGLIVHHIDDNGFLFVRALGGINVATLLGAVVDVHTKTGAVAGVVGVKPTHLMEREERLQLPKGEKIYVDIGASTKKDAAAKVRVGDPVTYRAGVVTLSKDRVASKSIDNRTGVFCAAETLRKVGRAKPKACVIALSTVGEEIGGDGARTAAFELEPDAAIAIDVTFAADQPEVTADNVGDVKLGGGPVVARGPRLNVGLLGHIEAAAKTAKIPLQYEVLANRTGTDADTIYPGRGGVPIGVVSVPSRYMHSPVEVASLSDLDRISSLLATLVKRLDAESTFEPFT